MNGKMQRYRVIRAYRSQYQQPISFAKGAELTVGEEDSGPEGWRGWYWCSLPGQASGWVPQQVFEWLDASRQRARAIADYSARELDTNQGDIVLGSYELNGWAWCQHPGQGASSGWVPLSHLLALKD